MNKVYVLGMGPGHKDYILPIALKKIDESDVLIGGKRLLKGFENYKKELIVIDSKLTKIVDYIKENKRHKKIALLLSGDTGFYSMLDYLKRYFKDEEIEVIPGISSYQYLMAKLNKSWHNSFIGSVHGRELNIIDIVKKYSRVILLTDFKKSPSYIASILMKEGVRNKRMIVGENLSYDNERIISGTLEDISNLKENGISVVVIEDE
ncbi:precorrin-6Y C5,15-methyltransferase (decarboxylating) [Caminicella sporogenes DSM 14501]|uniref:Precorrin-6Y C5,15-methyltransferase (Decarboxylating) n=1 Tax=Caminicella sporogenes DSM 14501 TaxID=1121266 RepID=A0A1M6MTJ5_9FIRM|nr:precorrin-6y C5,15-methyltransferase (decarboxylating) subunit CbiE [Caminicella sporogenes]RKD22507.1 precorrin-6y C5,15-methyltransferase (decarboxylating) subunit CbiE [Caminicella sporogenes]SHJ86777.1 precorrin-6Y C5,15-methyltransferase (decarboxylating) [Caminicella sporogenes DSM 14501]